MTTWEMQTRKYLDSVREMDRVVADLQDEKDRLQQAIYAIGSPGAEERVNGFPTSDRTIRQLMALERKREELAAAYNAYTDYRLKVTEQIHKIPKENQRMVLYQHYMQFQSLRTIAEKQYFDYTYITRLRREAIVAFWKKNKEVVEKYSKK